MDDDLNSLRGNAPSSDDDFFSSFENSSAETTTSSPTGAPAGGSGSLDLFDQPAAPAPAKKGKGKAPPKKKAKKRSAKAAGMTPQQRMILSIFLFLDVAVLGCLILVALGKIQL